VTVGLSISEGSFQIRASVLLFCGWFCDTELRTSVRPPSNYHISADVLDVSVMVLNRIDIAGTRKVYYIHYDVLRPTTLLGKLHDRRPCAQNSEGTEGIENL
jgi:hypothetical protein